MPRFGLDYLGEHPDQPRRGRSEPPFWDGTATSAENATVGPNVVLGDKSAVTDYSHL